MRIQIGLVASLSCSAALAWAGTAAAGNHYVDGAATGNGTGSSWASAWQSFASIEWAKVQPGDTIYISGGADEKSYNEQLTIQASGVSALPVTIASGASSPSPTGHDGVVVINAASSPYCVHTGDERHVTVRNLKCINAATNGIRANGSHVLIEGNTIDQVRGQAIHFAGCDSCTARRNVVTTLADDPAQTDGIVVYGGSDGVVIEGNHLVLTNQGGNHNDCIQSNKCQNLTIRYNYCDNSKDKEGYADAQGIYVTEMAGTNSIYGNVVSMKQGAVGIASRNLAVGTAKTLIIGNTVKCGSYRCVLVSEEADPVVQNNLVWQYRTAAGLYAIELADWAGSAANIDGNLSFNLSSSASVNALNGGGKTWQAWQTSGFDPNGLNVDPSLDDCYRPDSASDPSVGAGLVLASELGQGLALSTCPSTAADWIKGFALVDRSTVGGPGWDIGAFEYGSVPPGSDGGTDASVSDGGSDASLADAGTSDAADASTAPGASSGDDGGCGCRAAPRASRSSFAFVLLLLTLLGRAARRRGTRAA
jgi:hypothetical protein